MLFSKLEVSLCPRNLARDWESTGVVQWLERPLKIAGKNQSFIPGPQLPIETYSKNNYYESQPYIFPVL